MPSYLSYSVEINIVFTLFLIYECNYIILVCIVKYSEFVLIFCVSDLETERSQMHFIETSALDNTNVETAFTNILSGAFAFVTVCSNSICIVI